MHCHSSSRLAQSSQIQLSNRPDQNFSLDIYVIFGTCQNLSPHLFVFHEYPQFSMTFHDLGLIPGLSKPQKYELAWLSRIQDKSCDDYEPRPMISDRYSFLPMIVLEEITRNWSRAMLDIIWHIREHFFTHRIVNLYSGLPTQAVYASLVNDFKNKLDAHWLNQEMVHNYRVEISGTGSRSMS